MSDNLQERGGRDRSRIDVNEEWELRYWSNKLGVSADELKQAVKQLGDRAEDIERHFASRNQPAGR